MKEGCVEARRVRRGLADRLGARGAVPEPVGAQRAGMLRRLPGVRPGSP